jgi:isopentenyl-diphosphate delta-isomerase
VTAGEMVAADLADRESQLVELVDPTGAAIGSSTVRDAHRSPGRLHRAFSVLLLDSRGRLLLQQRAAVKTRFALRWANSCCGHPHPGAPVTEASAARLVEELGVTGVPLVEIGVHLYHADDPGSEFVEHEYDHVLLGRVDGDLRLAPDPAEVADLRWVPPDELRRSLAEDPTSYAPWLAGVVARLPNGLGERRP